MLNKSVFPRLCSVFSKLDGHTYCVVGMQNIVRKKGAAVRNVYYFNIDPIVAWEKANTKTGARTAKSAKGKSRGSMQIPVKSGAIAQAIGSGRDGVQIGAASVAGGDSGDSGPRLISTTGGGGGSGAWASFAALKKAADGGSPAALYELGHMYLDGSPDTPQNTAQALLYLERAASLGSSDANFRLGKLHADGGEGIPRDAAKAYGYYLAAARAGDPVAQHNVGAMLSSGRGVKRDYTEGLAWLILAAKKMPEAVEGEKRLRRYLDKHVDILIAAETRAAELEREIAVKR